MSLIILFWSGSGLVVVCLYTDDMFVRYSGLLRTRVSWLSAILCTSWHFPLYFWARSSVDHMVSGFVLRVISWRLQIPSSQSGDRMCEGNSCE